MARIKTYAQDTNLATGDKWIGTSSFDNETVNFSLESVANFLSKTGFADAARTGLVYTFQSASRARVTGGFTVPETTSTSIPLDSTLTSIVISNSNVNGTNVLPLLNFMVGGSIKINNSTVAGEENYALFGLSAIADLVEDGVAVPGFSVLTLSLIADSEGSSTAALLDGGQYALSLVSRSTGTGNSPANNLIAGTAVPTDALGEDGNFYLRVEADGTATSFGPKSAGSWPAGVVISGGSGITSVAITRGADSDAGNVTNGVLNLMLTSHTDTPPPTPTAFGGRYSVSRTYNAAGDAITLTNQVLTHNGGFTYDITDLRVPNGWTEGTIDNAPDNATFGFTIPTGVTPGTFHVEVDYSATDDSSNTTTGTVTGFVTVNVAAVPYYIFTQQTNTNLGTDDVQDLSTYTEVDTMLTNGSTITFTRPTTGTPPITTYFGAVAIRTQGTGMLVIDIESSFDEGQAIPDENIRTPIGVTNAGDYMVYIFPLHLPTTRIQIN